jgi:hypothetical protein
LYILAALLSANPAAAQSLDQLIDMLSRPAQIGELRPARLKWSEREILEFEPTTCSIKAWWIEDQ